MLTEAQKELIEERVQDVINMAEDLYKVDLGFVDIKYSLRSRQCVAKARVKCMFMYVNGAKTMVPGSARSPVILFNPEAFVQSWDDMMSDTIPHEVAHLVNYFAPHTGNNHDAGWQRVCVTLGGTGRRKCRAGMYQLTPGTVIKHYDYVATCGTPVTLKAGRHRKIQKGTTTYTLRATGGQLDRSCKYNERVVS